MKSRAICDSQAESVVHAQNIARRVHTAVACNEAGGAEIATKLLPSIP